METKSDSELDTTLFAEAKVHFSDFDKQNTTTKNSKLAAIELVPIESIECIANQSAKQSKATQNDDGLVDQLASSIEAPWGLLLVPLLVSKLPTPKDGKTWLLRDGLLRLRAAKKVGLAHVLVSILEGENDEQIQMLVHEATMIRRHPNAYQQIRALAEWHSLLHQVHGAYKPGGNKKKNADDKAAKGLPPFEEMVFKMTGLKKSTVAGKINVFNSIEPTEVRPYLDANPHCGTATKEAWLRRFKNYGYETQKQFAKYLPTLGNPDEANFQYLRELAGQKAKTLPVDDMFPIYHETFEENAKRIQDGSVDLIVTDPNWHLAEDSEKDDNWTEHGIPIAPQLTESNWHLFGQLAAKKLAPNGYAAILVGQSNGWEIEGFLRQHLKWRWEMCFLHTSGAGTAFCKARIASHFRKLLLFQRKDAPKTLEPYIQDIIGDKPKASTTPEALLWRMQTEHKWLEMRMKELQATGADPFMSDLIAPKVRAVGLLKKWHPWAQSVEAFREIIRRLSQPGDFIWEPFAGSGTTAIAAITCKDCILKGGKETKITNPRKGIGCDAMEIWASVAKCRVWATLHPDDPSSELFKEPSESDSNWEEQAA